MTDDDLSPYERVFSPSRFGWWALAAAALLVIFIVVTRFLGVVSFGLFLYYVGRPISRRFESVVQTPARAVTLTILAILLPFFVVLVGVIVIAIEQLLTLTDAEIDRVAESLPPGIGFEFVPDSPTEVGSLLVDQLQAGDVPALLGYGTEILTQLGGLILGVTLLFTFVYALLRYDRIAAMWFREVAGGTETAVGRFLGEIDRELSRIYAGQMLTVFVVVILSWFLYTGLNLIAPAELSIPLPLLLALLTGIASFVPLVGRSLVYIPLVLYLTVLTLQVAPRLLWFPAAVAVGGWLVLDPVIRYGVRPYLSSHGTPSSVMLIGYLLGGAVFGWYGVFLAPIVVVGMRRFLQFVFPPLVRGESI
jgi:predicted PurR-regulated permease PerM